MRASRANGVGRGGRGHSRPPTRGTLTKFRDPDQAAQLGCGPPIPILRAGRQEQPEPGEARGAGHGAECQRRAENRRDLQSGKDQCGPNVTCHILAVWLVALALWPLEPSGRGVP